ncbi:hypothetical protein C2G38_2104341 [Gigaspora rosea]|uniref:Uncharacterized protein n=1 Tax=Gigaspora rosea TaxID=44941 RepID=A0A397UVB4_9GLOM|nr:hypothetical protein C2G38_2104341 [Gigaspora rosea]
MLIMCVISSTYAYVLRVLEKTHSLLYFLNAKFESTSRKMFVLAANISYYFYAYCTVHTHYCNIFNFLQNKRYYMCLSL